MQEPTSSRASAILRQLSTPGVGSSQVLIRHPLTLEGNVLLGRDGHCQIMLDSTQYGMVSRRHAELRPVILSPLPTSGEGPREAWELCDLNSANGTYVNGLPLEGCRVLWGGDRIQLGQDGPEFLYEDGTASSPASPPHRSQEGSVTFSQLFPIASTGHNLTHKAYLLPGAITVAFVVLLFSYVGNEVIFNRLLATYLSGAAYYFVYQLCGKRKPLWLLMGTALATILLLSGPLLPVFVVIFRQILPGGTLEAGQSIPFPLLLVKMFFGAGLMEELLKALPVLGLYWVGRWLRSPWKERIGVWEPLDGILLGAASAVGFTLFETLGQYVPTVVEQTSALQGLQLLIPRIIGSVAGHMAYSGYLGYFIGLSVMKPASAWKILITGYCSAAALHTLWNASGFFHPSLLALVGILSYAFLAAAILKARTLSPNRQRNFATRFLR